MSKKDGELCAKCGTSSWYNDGACKYCRKIYAREYREKNRARIRKKEREWCANNRKKKNASFKKWMDKNKSKNRERARKWRLDNIEYARQYDSDYGKAHKEEKRAKESKRRAKQKGNGGQFTKSEWILLCRHYEYLCLSCGKRYDIRKLEVDHVKPLVLGGDSNITNIQPLCRSCNASKGAKHIDYRTKDPIKRWVQGDLLG